MKRRLSGVMASTLVLSTLLAPAAFADTTSNQFVDVQSNASYASAVSELVSKGVVRGTDSTHFNPTGSMTRAEFASMIVRAMGLTINTSAAATFSDVSTTYWGFGAIEAASKAGIISGEGNGKFDPEAHVTREQAAKMIIAALGKQGSIAQNAMLNFADNSSVDTWAAPYVALATQLKVAFADSSNHFMGNGILTRSDAAIWIDSIFHMSDSTSVDAPSELPITSGFKAKPFAQASTAQNGPDDITYMNGHVFVNYQNGVGAKGEASKTGNTNSTVVEFDNNGNMINQWSITGKCDGLTADTANNRLLATVNEDGNSSMYVITPGAAQGQQVQHLTFNVDMTQLPATNPLATGGGTDSIAIQNGNIYLTASAPAADAIGNFTHTALFEVTIQGLTATLQPVFMDNAKATDEASGNQTTLNLSDPDSSTVVPAQSPQFAGDFMLDSQGDSELIFADQMGTSNQKLTRLSLGTQVDDVAWATSQKGTLYVVDGGSNKIYAITGDFAPGTAFAACPSDSGVAGFVGTVDLTSGTITPFAIGLKSPKGLLFVPQSQ